MEIDDSELDRFTTDLGDADDLDTLIFYLDYDDNDYLKPKLKAESYKHYYADFACSHKMEGKPGNLN